MTDQKNKKRNLHHLLKVKLQQLPLLLRKSLWLLPLKKRLKQMSQCLLLLKIILMNNQLVEIEISLMICPLVVDQRWEEKVMICQSEARVEVTTLIT
jgi:hypothetical protein